MGRAGDKSWRGNEKVTTLRWVSNCSQQYNQTQLYAMTDTRMLL
jgi:hypothetical protein